MVEMVNCVKVFVTTFLKFPASFGCPFLDPGLESRLSFFLFVCVHQGLQVVDSFANLGPAKGRRRPEASSHWPLSTPQPLSLVWAACPGSAVLERALWMSR